jgi:hypothetical protein
MYRILVSNAMAAGAMKKFVTCFPTVVCNVDIQVCIYISSLYHQICGY